MTSMIMRASAAAVMPLRERVMYPNNPERCRQDGDEEAIHLAAYESDVHEGGGELIVGVVSVYLTDKGDAIFRKLAVAPEVQGRGIGSTLVRAAAEEAKDAGCSRLYCHVRPNMEQYYVRKLGFRRHGEPFEKYGHSDILE